MADPRHRDERLAPSLLDRLIDLDPDLPHDSAISDAETPSGLKSALRRDLEVLLNTRCLPQTPPLSMPELADSLVSLGVEDFFAASLVTDAQRNDFARRLQTRITRFEPRLENLSVTILADPLPGRRGLRLRISAHYRARPGMPPVVFETRMDPVVGHFRVVEGARG
jgi:type VI secretion system protein ImpF